MCPVGTHPSERLWAINGEPCTTTPPTSPPCSQSPCQLPPRNRTIKESQRGGVGRGDQERLPKPLTERALGGPDSRSVIVHFLLGCGPFLDPLRPIPSSSPSSTPRSFPPHPLFLGQVSQSSGKQAGLQAPGFSHLPPKPQLTLVPERIKAPAATTKPGSEAKQNHSEQTCYCLHLKPYWRLGISCDVGTWVTSVGAHAYSECLCICIERWVQR